MIAQWRKGLSRLPLTYVHAIELAGGRARVLSTFDANPTEEAPEGMDVHYGLDPLDPSSLDGASGLLLPGGGDIDPELYGKTRHPRTHNVSQRRDRFELTLLGEALERDMPVLAICHGMQLLNVCFGGTLVQHIADSPRRLNHDRDRPRAEPAHGLHLGEGSLLAEIFGSVSVQINSHHHQGLDGAAGPLEEIGWAEDGVLEAVVSKEHSWVVGVQWHPEAMAPVDAAQLKLFEAFVSAVRSHAVETPTEQARTA